MKLYKHYKNKKYKYRGIAKHSESLEDLVLYETLYDNPLGKLWVRPKEMFFGEIEIAGQSRPRFQEVPLDITETTQIGEPEIQFIGRLMKRAFEEWDPKWFFETYHQHQKFHLLMARVEGEPAGFKLGYEKSSDLFYSWLGGVDPDHRSLGIAADLMKAQHAWCQAQGYKKVQTKTQNRFREMLLLNIRFGFNVLSLHDSNEGGPKILLEKEFEAIRLSVPSY